MRSNQDDSRKKMTGKFISLWGACLLCLCMMFCLLADMSAEAAETLTNEEREYEILEDHIHTVVTDTSKAPTCTEAGKTEGSHCTVCGDVIQAQEIIPSTGHHYKKTISQKATTKKTGLIEEKCISCGKKTESTTTIYAASGIKLSKTSFTYNGKNQKPTVIVKNSEGNKLPAGSYKITYPKTSKNIGEYTITVTLQGNYSGTVKLTYRITPKGTSISKLTAKKQGFIAKWKKQTGQTTGYELQYSMGSKFKKAKTVTVKKNKTVSKSIAKLKAGKKYYVRIRTYKTVKVNGKSVKLCSGWSKVKSVKTSSGSGGSSATTPTTHTHKWKKHTATKKVWVSKMVTVNDYEEQRKEVCYYKCNCGARFNTNGEIKAHQLAAVDAFRMEVIRNGTAAKTSCGNYLIYHDYVTEKVKVGSHKEDHGHYKNSTYVDYYYCDCGAKK